VITDEEKRIETRHFWVSVIPVKEKPVLRIIVFVVFVVEVLLGHFNQAWLLMEAFHRNAVAQESVPTRSESGVLLCFTSTNLPD
jgi:hypothetical protein